jgi:predicted CXXCH cytochrome family protein
VSRKVLLFGVGALLCGGGTLFLAFRRHQTGAVPPQSQNAYVDSATCTGCHQEIAKTYRLTGMGRSLYRPTPANTVEDYRANNHIFNATSDRYYALIERDGKLFQRRHQIGPDEKEINIVEKQVDYVIGSGNHVRSYLHRTAQGTLVEMPVSWYAEKGGYWAMSPGYDRPNQEDFRRTIVAECLFCHDAYPRSEQTSNLESSEPIFGDLPEGIDCQRCHGPGGAHIEAAGSGHASRDEIRNTIVNPARLVRERQLEVCMQCHLETSSRPLPNKLPRYGHAPFSYRAGEPLADYFTFFDRSKGSGREDTFEIAHAAYRLRKSQCFQSSQMTCTTCHDPHQIPRGAEAVRHYNDVCRNCHASAHSAAIASTGNCIECHMPKRRTEDVVHAAITDHFIQRRKPTDLLKPLQESEFANDDHYRGGVSLYYPNQLQHAPENDLILDVAQVHDGANLKSGIPRLEQDIQKYSPAEADFYYELAESYSKAGDNNQAIRWYQEALQRRPDYPKARQELGITLIAAGETPRAVEVLEKAAASPFVETVALADLGGAYIKLGNPERAAQVLDRVLALNPDSPEAHNFMGLLLGQKNDWAGAEQHLRAAIANQPDMAEAHYNLANLLARAKNYSEAQYHFQKAIAMNPAYADAHHNYGLLLVLMGSYGKALDELQEAVRLDPNSAQGRSDLADVQAAMSRR